jgi:dimethylglycine dehydrogenase
MEAGGSHGMRLFGGRAIDSLRLEKSFGSWATEYRNVYDPYEAGLGHFVKLDKGDFIGREAASAAKEAGPARKLVAFVVDADDADVSADEPIFFGDDPVGWVTSGGYGHYTQTSIALGYVPIALADESGGFTIEILGVRRRATIQPKALHDPQGSRMRS